MSLPELPAGLELEYFAEGAANVVYRMLAPLPSPSVHSEAYSDSDEYGPGTPPPSEIPVRSIHPLITGKLLRLRKDLPTATSILDAQQDFKQHVKPLFREGDLVQQMVVCLPASLIDRYNDDLRMMEASGARAKKRSGIYLRIDGYGTLVTDLSRQGDITFSASFKPKWLVQSPSAPKEAKRCRTCALRAMRASQKVGKDFEGYVSMKGGTCPLSLVSEDEDKVHMGVNALISGSVKAQLIDSENPIHHIVQVLQTSSVLRRLKDLQLKLDPDGPLIADPTNPRFLTAMALRDCTVFIAGPSPTDESIEVRLGDLDVKSPRKAGYWRSLEEDLIHGGWYTATELFDGDEVISCALQQ